MYKEKLVKTLRSFLLLLLKSNLWWWTLEQNVSHWQAIIVNSGDTNLIVCYLDAGRPMWCSYLCDRCSTTLHLQSQPAPSLQAVDLNSSESTQWEGKWWMECMECWESKVEFGPRPLMSVQLLVCIDFRVEVKVSGKTAPACSAEEQWSEIWPECSGWEILQINIKILSVH